MIQALKAIAFCLVAALPPVTLVLLFFAACWLVGEASRRWERRRGITHDTKELCRCGAWYCAHNDYLGSTQTACMGFRARS